MSGAADSAKTLSTPPIPPKSAEARMNKLARLIKNDPKYNEQWPRALVPYKRIYGVDEPRA